MSHLAKPLGVEPLSRPDETHDARSEFGLQLILSGICYLPAADVTCARISNARHLPVEENIAAAVCQWSRESSNEIHRQGVQAFDRAKFVHMSFVLSA